jgi:hypothetical protein
MPQNNITIPHKQALKFYTRCVSSLPSKIIAAPLKTLTVGYRYYASFIVSQPLSKQVFIAAASDCILSMTRECLSMTNSNPDSNYATTTTQKKFAVLDEFKRKEKWVIGVHVHAIIAEDSGGRVALKMA